MKFIVKVFPEIIMKSHPVRKRFMKVLAGNIRHVLSMMDESVAVVQHWDFIEVRTKNDTKAYAVREQLQRISGIHHILQVDEVTFHSLEDIAEYTYEHLKDELVNKSFCVRARRRGEHNFDSMEVMRYVGGQLNWRIPSARVQLKNPEVVVQIEIDKDKLMLVKERFSGLGGFPMSTQEDVLSLISGGFDSAVASFALMRRGSRVHYCFFNLGGQAHEVGVKQMAYHLWQRYSKSHKVWFVAIDFEPVVAEILQTVQDGQMGVVLKRMMVRAASSIAQRFKVEAIVTGEALGQVASQSLTNLRLIDDASSCLVLRPLIAHDKEEIVRLCEHIGAFDIAKSIPEFCGVISKSPTVKARADTIQKQEAKFDFAVLEHAIKTAKVSDIRELAKTNIDDICLPKIVDVITEGQVVIDIRTPDEVEELPLTIAQTVLTIPFYKLSGEFAALDSSKEYLLYCQQGVMSRLQAGQLMAQGFDNVGVLSLPKL